MDTRTYTVTPAQLDAIGAELRGQGFAFDPTQPSGAMTAKGFEVGWALNSAAGTVAITVLKHPFGEEGFFWSAVESKLGKPIG